MNKQFHSFTSIAKHIAIIMDGNGRWAQGRNKSVSYGHKQGAQRVEEIIEASLSYKVKYLTLFAFSTENWQRPKLEVRYLMNLLAYTLNNKIKQLDQLGVKIKIIGDKKRLSSTLIKLIKKTEQQTKTNHKLQLNIAINYGGIWDIEQAFIKILKQVVDNQLNPTEITEQLIDRHISLAGCPNPDLLIRTSGERRISNFLLWNLQNTQLKFIAEKWPDFTTEHYLQVLKVYNQSVTDELMTIN